MKVYTLAELLGLKEDPERWIIPDAIPASGRVVIYGASGIGKSWVTVDLALSVAIGGEWLGLVPVRKHGPVLVASTEGDIYSNRDRVQWLCNTHALEPGTYDSVPLYYMQEPLLLDTRDGQQNFAELLEMIRPALVVLDPLDSFFMGEENSATATKPLRRILDWAVLTYGTTIVLLHHETKSNAQLRGSGAWWGWFDSVIYARGVMGQGIALEAKKQRNGRAGPLVRVGLHIEPSRGLARFTSLDPVSDGNEEWYREAILDLLRGQGVSTVQTLMSTLRRGGAAVHRLLDQLERGGMVRRRSLIAQDSTAARYRVEGWEAVGAGPESAPPGHIN